MAKGVQAAKWYILNLFLLFTAKYEWVLSSWLLLAILWFKGPSHHSFFLSGVKDLSARVFVPQGSGSGVGCGVGGRFALNDDSGSVLPHDSKKAQRDRATALTAS